MKHRLATVLMLAIACTATNAQNPYLPLWEFIPDGEPYVFEDPDNPGKYRVYIYGSHDNLVTEYCGRDQVVWSAPVEDLGAWRYDGVIFQSIYDANGELLSPDGTADVLYAPDVALKVDKDGNKKYYLYPNVQNWGRNNLVAVSDRPDGPFKVCNWSKDNPKATVGPLGFDPGVLVDDDGRVYGYWGFGRSFAAELDPETMCTVKEGAEIVEDMVSSHNEPTGFRFFEASSIRKIKNKYVFVYSRVTEDGEFGLGASNNTLAYAYSDNPTGPWTYGGTLIDARGREKLPDGSTVAVASPYGNTHGSLCKIGRKWWVFYHRQTGLDQFSRQAMVAPVKVKVQKRKGGKVIISEGECTSEGFSIKGLDPMSRTKAAIASYFHQPKGSSDSFPNFFWTGSYVQPDSCRKAECTVVNNTDGSIIGYKYFKMRPLRRARNLRFTVELVPQGVDGKITVLVGGPTPELGGKVIAEIPVSANAPCELQSVTTGVNKVKGLWGKKAVYLAFSTEAEDTSLCTLHAFQFVADQKSLRTNKSVD